MVGELRFLTYMVPSRPVEVYEVITHYLEECMGCETSLIYESRSDEQLANHKDPFLSNKVDIGKIISYSLQILLSLGKYP